MSEVTVKTKKRKARRTVVGIVSSANKATRTLRVEVQYKVRYPIYGKFVGRTSVLHAHDEKSEAKKGDRVQLMECRPFSKTKTWRLIKVLESAP